MSLSLQSDQERGVLLIVDDDEMNRAILENIFKKDYTADHAENGKVGLDCILQTPDKYSAILLDVVMPEMNGIEVLRRMNTESLTKALPVFLITGEANDAIIKEAYDLGVMDVILKPVTPHIVQRRVNSVVELFRARKILGGQVETLQAEQLHQAQKLLRMNEGMIESLSTAIEFRSGESGEHVRRIRDITCFLLRHTDLGDGIAEADKESIALAAVMHDVGKIAISDAILNKPGKLTPEEFTIMKTHTQRGAELLEKIPQLREHDSYLYAYDIALHHHERWDGRGYPDGLKGDEITIWAQIVSLADVYDALVSERCYKRAFSREEARSMILGNKCGVFNPLLLDRFFSVEDELAKLYVHDQKEA